MTIKKKIANAYNWLKGIWIKKFIVIHYSAGSIDTDENNGEYFGRERVGVSANAFVDDDSVTISVPLTATAYHCGKDYSNGKAPYWRKCTNSNSIGIEMCGIANDKILDMRNKTIKNTVRYTKKLMKQFKISHKKVVRHYDVCGKNCPAPMVEHPVAWDCFKLNIQTPFKVKTTINGVKMFDKLGGKVVKRWKKGQTLNIVAVYVYNGELYGKGKNSRQYQKLKYTNYKKYLK
ncbi:N-acetylmuramoyl-L-alanine amidase family protein [Eubacterium sp.]|uniref:peptidoglycan recognition protein family protein n=1 Tax=Eubacterium TaxID=1730 RepID=UPI003992FA28